VKSNDESISGAAGDATRAFGLGDLSTLLHRVARAANEATSVEAALEATLDAICEQTGWPLGHAYLPPVEGDGWRPSGVWHCDDPARYAVFQRVTASTFLPPGQGLPGQIVASGQPLWIPDLESHGNFPRWKLAAELGVRSGFGLPVVLGSEVVAVLEFFSPEPTAPDAALLATLAEVAAQLGRVVERSRAAAALAAGAARTRAIIDSASDAFVEVDTTGRITDWNRQAEATFGWTADEAEGLLLTGTIIPDRFHEAHLHGITRFLATGEGPVLNRSVELVACHRDGHEIPIELTVWPLQVGEETRFNAFIRDIGERKRAEEALRRSEETFRYQALHDPLTGLANRELFRDRAGHALDRSRRSGGTHAVLFIDVDTFKTINDSLGHAIGDAVLTELAGRLGSELRPSDTAARLGGDEFAVLMEDANEIEATDVARRVLEMFRRPVCLDDRELVLSASIGVALTEVEQQVEELLRNADVAMYEAKRRGGNRHAVFATEMQVAARRRFDLEADLRRALDAGGLYLEYQPVVALPSATIVGVEALVRWLHPERGLIGPDEFIPVAEDSRLIRPLARWVLNTACSQARQLAAGPSGPLWLSVNVSTRELEDEGFVAEVEAALCDSKLHPSLLVLEITESLFIRDIATSIGRLSQLKALGVRLAIDDFGTGYSSLSYLRDLPLDILKIDRSFVDVVAFGPEKSAVARAVVKLARTFGLAAVAEGVERPEQADALSAMGCDMAQGYWFARPLDPPALEEFLAAAAGCGELR
jgi:diguanylate cyclase (GGDEF)-like protein/PAS domain S-box-containing protein